MIPTVAIDHTDPRPPFRQIADDLRQQILDGRLAPGQKLPSERELVERHGAAQATVRQALAVLRVEGLVTPHQGKGVFVRRLPKRVELDATSEIIAAGDERGGVPRLLEASYTIPSEQVAALLQLTDATEEAWTRRFLISTVDGQPLHLATSYFAGSLAKGTPIGEHLELSRAAIGLYLWKTYCLLVGRVRDDITVRMPTPEEVRALRLLPGTPVLDMLRTYISTTGRPIEVIDIVLAGDKHALVYERATRPSLDEIEETDLPPILLTDTRLSSPGTPPQSESESGAPDVGDIEVPAFPRPRRRTKG
jgi:GntR family transcriptional regulator